MKTVLPDFLNNDMGLSLRFAYQLYKERERKRKISEFKFNQRSMLSGAHGFNTGALNIRSSRANSRKTLAVGCAVLIHLGCLLIHLKDVPGGQVTILPIMALFLSLISIVRLLVWMDDIGPEDVFKADNQSRAEFLWKRVIKLISSGTKRRLLKLEQSYLKMKNFALLINQLVFFSLCERVFLDKRQPITSFYTLMFYNVIAYCISYVKELIEREDWSLAIKVAKGSNVRHLAMSATNIVLEWTKAIAFIMTVVFILLVSGLEKGLKNYTPNTPYLTATGLYFVLTEKVFVDLIFLVFEELKLDCFESMEKLYSPIILKGAQILLSLTLTVTCGMLGYVRITSLAAFTNVRTKYKELDDDHFRPLKRELLKLIGFRTANREEIRRHDDVCAVCLAPMKSARVTPCSHLFHAECLRRCLTEASLQCPICKSHLSVKCSNFFSINSS